MTLRAFVSDTVELIDRLAARFGQDRVYLLGHSWGTIVGATVACEHPARLHAHVAVCPLPQG